MRQQTLADGSIEKFRKKTRKEPFQDDMEQFIPWQELCGANEPYYPKQEVAGRRQSIKGKTAPLVLADLGLCRRYTTTARDLFSGFDLDWVDFDCETVV